MLANAPDLRLLRNRRPADGVIIPVEHVAKIVEVSELKATDVNCGCRGKSVTVRRTANRPSQSPENVPANNERLIGADVLGFRHVSSL
jgi:hypothetical protein